MLLRCGGRGRSGCWHASVTREMMDPVNMNRAALAFVLACTTLTAFVSSPARACSTFCMQEGSRIVSLASTALLAEDGITPAAARAQRSPEAGKT